jgi:hypothetical protein
MTMRSRFSRLCAVAIVILLDVSCAASSAETGAAASTMPAAAVDEPSAEPSALAAAVTALPPPEPAPEPAAAIDQTPMPLFGAAVITKVKDFAAWKSVFDADVAARKEAGFAAQGIMRGLDSEKQVVVWLAVTDVEKAKTFFADKSLRARMKAAGVEGKPEIHLWSNVEAKMDPGKQGLSAAMITAKVKDVGAFKTSLDVAAQSRSDAGIVGYSLSQDVDDKSTAYIYLQSEDPSKLKAFVAAKETKQNWRDAGVKGVPLVTFLKEGEITTYQ